MGERQYKDLEKTVWSREGIGLQPAETQHRKNSECGSRQLREACLDLFSKTANRYQISMADAMACHLGFHSPPKAAPAPFKTASAMRRLAA